MNVQPLLFGGFCLVSGLVMLIAPRISRIAASEKANARKSQIDSGAPERFFEERRSLEAYPVPSDGGWRMRGALFTIIGLTLLGLSFTR